MNDMEAIKLIKLKDQKGFNYIYNKYVYQIYGYIYHMVNDKMIAEDLTSDTFYKLYKNAKKYKEKGNFKAYLFRIAHNLIIDYYRKSHIEYTYDETILNDKSDDYHENELKKINQTLLQRIEKKLETFKERERALIMLFYFEELDLKTIAHMLNMNINSAKVALFRARQKLIKEVSNEI